METITKKFLGNFQVLSVEGTLLFRTNKKRVDWYMKRGLAKEISADTIQLNFQTNGDGNASDPEYYNEIRENKCVKCGTEEHLTRHHIVPSKFRRHFPLSYKDRSSFDIVILCSHCHEDIEKLMYPLEKRYLKLAGKLIDENNQIIKRNKQRKRLISLREKKLDYLGAFQTFFQNPDMSLKDALEAPIELEEEIDLYKEVIDKVNLEDFIINWRKNFIRIAEYPYLSPKWAEAVNYIRKI
jgi:hypothetical protein